MGNYSAVQNMHRLGHEIAAHSITHNDDEAFWSEAKVDDWAREMGGSRLIIEKFARIKDNSVVGLRAPYLRVGGNNQFTMMEEQGFLYDSSITAPLQNPPLWPYTMYFKMPHRCHGNLQSCPTRSHAVWEMVMNELDRREDPSIDEDLPGCAMIDSCSNILTGDQFYNFLTQISTDILTRTEPHLVSLPILPGLKIIQNSRMPSSTGWMRPLRTTKRSTL